MFGIAAHMKEGVDLPIKTYFAVSKISEEPYFETFAKKADAENFAKKSAQKYDALFAVYELKLIGSAWPSSATYEEMK